MDTQREIFIAKASLMYEEDPSVSVERSYNLTIGEMISRIGETNKTIVIDNFQMDIQNIALLEICRTISLIANVDIIVISKKYAKRLKRFIPALTVKKTHFFSPIRDEFWVSPKMLHNFYTDSYSDSSYSKIDYYPLMKMVYRDVKSIASTSKLIKYVKNTTEGSFIRVLYGLATRRRSTITDDTLTSTMNRILAGRSNLVKKFIIIGSGNIPFSSISLDCDRIIVYNRNDDFDSRDIPYGRRPNKVNTIFGRLEEFLEENKGTDIYACGYFDDKDSKLLQERNIKIFQGAL